jgi:hypothetical protein
MKARMKAGLRQNGYKPEKRIKGGVSQSFENTNVPTKAPDVPYGHPAIRRGNAAVEDGIAVSSVKNPAEHAHWRAIDSGGESRGSGDEGPTDRGNSGKEPRSKDSREHQWHRDERNEQLN